MWHCFKKCISPTLNKGLQLCSRAVTRVSKNSFSRPFLISELWDETGNLQQKVHEVLRWTGSLSPSVFISRCWFFVKQERSHIPVCSWLHGLIFRYKEWPRRVRISCNHFTFSNKKANWQWSLLFWAFKIIFRHFPSGRFAFDEMVFLRWKNIPLEKHFDHLRLQNFAL